jgi:CRP-like cAMP-binding protein/Ca2+-binding EF-hand superfamily protein
MHADTIRCHPQAWAGRGYCAPASTSATARTHLLNFAQLGSAIARAQGRTYERACIRRAYEHVIEVLADYVMHSRVVLRLPHVGGWTMNTGRVEFLLESSFCQRAKAFPERTLEHVHIVSAYETHEPAVASVAAAAAAAAAAPAPATTPPSPSGYSDVTVTDIDVQDEHLPHRDDGGVYTDSSHGSVVSSGQRSELRDQLAPTHADEPAHIANHQASELGTLLTAESKRQLTSQEGTQLHRICRVLDVFAAFDSKNTGALKDHDVTVGLREHFGMRLSRDEAKDLFAFLARNNGGKLSRQEFVRAYLNWERVCSIEEQAQSASSLLRKVPLLQPLIADQPEFAGILAQKLQRTSVCAGDLVISKGDIGNAMYFVASGTLQVFSDLDESPLFTNSVGSFFGETALVHAVPRNAYVQALTACELFVLTKVSFDGVLKTSKRLRSMLGMTPQPRVLASKSAEAADEVAPLSLLQNVPLFLAMSDAAGCLPSAMQQFISALEPCLKRVFIPVGRFVVREGDFATDMYFIADGTVDVVAGSSDVVLAKLAKGNCFGELALLFRERRMASIRASSDCHLWKLAATDFVVALQRVPQVSSSLLYMAEQRRLAAIRGTGSIPDIFRQSAMVITDHAVHVDTHNKQIWQMKVPVWQLRSILGEVLLLWSTEQIEWLMTGEAVGDPAYIITAADRHLAIDYNRVLLPAEVHARRQHRAPISKMEQHKMEKGGSPTSKRVESRSFAKFRDRIFQQKASLYETFRAFDVDGDGHITIDEFEECFNGRSKAVQACLGDLKELDLAPSDVASIFDQMDKHQSGIVSYSEFCQSLDQQLEPDWQSKIVQAVQVCISLLHETGNS